MKYGLGQKVKVNKDIKYAKQGEIGIVVEIDAISIGIGNNYKVYIESDDIYHSRHIWVAEELIDAYNEPKFKKGDIVKLKTEYAIKHTFPYNEKWQVNKYFPEHNTYHLYQIHPEYNCVTSSRITLKEEKLERTEMSHNPNYVDIETAKKIVKIINDFNVQVNRAGGMSWDIERLEKTSALELILHLAPNNVKFKYEGEK